MTIQTRPDLIPLHFLPLLLVQVANTELRGQRISSPAIAAVLVLAAIRAALVADGAWIAIAGGVTAGAIFAATSRLVPGGVGRGDTRLATALGALVGAAAVLRALLWACLLALLPELWRRHQPASEAGRPFGPYLVAGAIIACVSEFFPSSS